MALGVLVGIGTGLAVLTGADIPGVGSWLVAVAVAKLGFIASFALIAAGAALRRVATRSPHGDPADAASLPGRSDRALTSGPPTSPLPVQRDAVKEPRHNTP